MEDRAKCFDCGLPYGGDNWVDMVLPNEQWNEIFPEHNGLLCPNCIMKRASKLNTIRIDAKLVFSKDI